MSVRRRAAFAVRRNPFSVSGHVAQPASASSLNQSWAMSWWMWSGSNNATRTFTSSKATAVTVRHSRFVEQRFYHLNGHDAAALGGKERHTVTNPLRCTWAFEAFARQFREYLPGCHAPSQSELLRRLQNVVVNVDRGSHDKIASRITHQMSTLATSWLTSAVR
jgi:hypothetical protein